MNNRIAFIGVALGIIFLLSALFSFIYCERIVDEVSGYLGWHVDYYPYRQYSFLLLILATISFLIVGIAYSLKSEFKNGAHDLGNT